MVLLYPRITRSVRIRLALVCLRPLVAVCAHCCVLCMYTCLLTFTSTIIHHSCEELLPGWPTAGRDEDGANLGWSPMLAGAGGRAEKRRQKEAAARAALYQVSAGRPPRSRGSTLIRRSPVLRSQPCLSLSLAHRSPPSATESDEPGHRVRRYLHGRALHGLPSRRAARVRQRAQASPTSRLGSGT